MRDYYRLTKPGIIYGNAITAIAGFVFASSGHFNIPLFLAMLIGLCSIIASGCVINNILDRDIDAHMERTKERAIPMGRISVRNALIFAIVLGAVGIAALLFTNAVTLSITLFGAVIYIGAYTPLKRISHHSTIVGALAGAVPPVVGYTAVVGHVDAIAVILFLILVSWQMTHFLAISLFRRDDYAAAHLPVMSVRFSSLRTKIVMVAYAFVFAYAAFVLALTAHLGLLFTLPVGLATGVWCLMSLAGFFTKNERGWARMTFFTSLVVLLVFSLALALS